MARLKSMFAGLLLTVLAGLGSHAQAQTVQVMFAGSPEMWQILALGAYNGGACLQGFPCAGHYTTPFFNLIDSRPTPAVTDVGPVWIVWDSASPPNVWAYVKVDSVVGVRSYFAVPAGRVCAPPSFPQAANLIGSTLWGNGTNDSIPPVAIQALFQNACVGVNVAATDVRPEDALWAMCRANSALGNGSAGGKGSGDGLDGLGYNAANPPGVCPQFGAPPAALVGTAIQGTGPSAKLVAFNIKGNDPFTNKPVPAFDTESVGAAPITFILSRYGGQLTALQNATEFQLQTVFSGANCDAAVFGLPKAGFNAFLREPISGPANVVEATVFRRPTVPATGGFLGLSQETGVNATNPFNNVPCGTGLRRRANGNLEGVRLVLDSVNDTNHDGLGYTFFNYVTISPIANTSMYGYIKLNGVDPIFHAYSNGATAYDPGQPVGIGVLPAAANLPASCAGLFPCPENAIWKGGLSFPNLRNGSYRAWSMLRLVSSGAALANARKVVASALPFVVTSIPDFVPATPTKVAIGGKPFTDPGLNLLRSHYLQVDGAGMPIGLPFVTFGRTKEAGGDMGGCILAFSDTTATGDIAPQLIQNASADSSDLGCVVR